MMAKYEYLLLDVFTERAFGGNQLAVFPKAQGLSSVQMQALANELNLAETTFVLPPQNAENDFWVRIFTPVHEMPMAGHPTIGTAFGLALEKLIPTAQAEITVKFEEKVGLIPVKIRLENNSPVFCQMSQPLPEFDAPFKDQATIAQMLGLAPQELEENLPIAVVSCGVPYLIVPVKNLAAIQKIKVRLDLLQSLQPQINNASIYAFTTETVTANAQTHSRMFWSQGGMVVEDAATGSASGPLGCYLVRHKVLAPSSNQTFLNEQGFEMNRPSFIQIEVEQKAEKITAVRVGGQSYYMGKGFFEL